MNRAADLPVPTEGAPSLPAVSRFWKPSALAAQLGFSRQAIYAAIKAGHLPAVRIFGAIRIREADVLAYLSKCEGRR